MKKLLTLALALFFAVVIHAKKYKIMRVDYSPDPYAEFVTTHPNNSFLDVGQNNITVVLDSVTFFQFSLEPWEGFDGFDYTKEIDISVWERLTDKHTDISLGFWENEENELIGYTLGFVAPTLRSYLFFIKEI